MNAIYSPSVPDHSLAFSSLQGSAHDVYISSNDDHSQAQALTLRGTIDGGGWLSNEL